MPRLWMMARGYPTEITPDPALCPKSRAKSSLLVCEGMLEIIAVGLHYYCVSQGKATTYKSFYASAMQPIFLFLELITPLPPMT